MREDDLIKEISEEWSVDVPDSLEKLAEFMEVVGRNVALRQNIDLVDVKITLNNEIQEIRMGYDEQIQNIYFE